MARHGKGRKRSAESAGVGAGGSPAKRKERGDSEVSVEAPAAPAAPAEKAAPPSAEALARGDSAPGTGQVRKVIVILDEATLEPVKTAKGSYELLNCDDHLGLHKKLKKEPSQSRPDIAHQMLLALLDSPLNKAGHLQVFLRTNQNVLVQVSEHLRIPRTFKRFSGLMVQLLHQLKIRAVDGSKTLLKVIKNPITRHLPPDVRVFAAEVDGTLVDVHEFVPALPDGQPVAFVFGAIAHGDIKVDYAEAKLSFSEYPLSGACAVSRLCCAFERKWGII